MTKKPAAGPVLSDAAARYVDDVAAHLSPLPAAARRAALADLRDLFAEGVEPSELGPAEEYAAALAPPPTPGEVQGHVLGLPVDVRGATDARVRARAFDPSDPRVFVPRVFGGGWRLNYGAVAVRLGLLRPDDYDADVLSHIPPAVTAVTRTIPLITLAKTAFWVATAWRTGPRVPSHWDALGRVDGWSDRRMALLPLLAVAGGAAWWGGREVPTAEDRLVREAMAASAGATATAVAVLTAWSAQRPTARHPEVAFVALAPLATAAVMLIYPVRAGLRALNAAGGRAARPNAAAESPNRPETPQETTS